VTVTEQHITEIYDLTVDTRTLEQKSPKELLGRVKSIKMGFYGRVVRKYDSVEKEGDSRQGRIYDLRSGRTMACAERERITGIWSRAPNGVQSMGRSCAEPLVGENSRPLSYKRGPKLT